jgi:hypothetical protein
MRGLKIFCLLPLALVLMTQSASAADTPTPRDEVEMLFKLTRMEQKINESVDFAVRLQLQQDPRLQQHRALLQSFMQRHIGWEALKEEIAAMYLRTFTQQELKQMNAFYITPTGQKVITQLPLLVQERNQLAMQRLQANIGELQRVIEQETGSQGSPGGVE